jgi:hypothetical protein
MIAPTPQTSSRPAVMRLDCYRIADRDIDRPAALRNGIFAVAIELREPSGP